MSYQFRPDNDGEQLVLVILLVIIVIYSESITNFLVGVL
jgi:hypothetical protein